MEGAAEAPINKFLAFCEVSRTIACHRYRLNVFPIAVPPLRERREDISLLAWHFVKKYSDQMNKCIAQIPEETIQALNRYHWPGNIRELQNVIERAVILTQGNTLNVPLEKLDAAWVRGEALDCTTPNECVLRPAELAL